MLLNELIHYSKTIGALACSQGMFMLTLLMKENYHV